MSDEILDQGLQDTNEETPQQSNYVLIISDKQQNVETRIDLEENQDYIAGANPQSGIVISDPCVSWRHCKLSLSGDKCSVEDLGSKNGVFLKIDAPIDIVPGQTLFIGTTLIRLEKTGGHN